LVQMNPIEPELQPEPPASEPSIDPPHPILAEQTHLAHPSQSATPQRQQLEPLPLENLAEQTHFADSLQLRANLPQHYPQRNWGPAAISTSPDPNPETNPPKQLAEIPVPENLAEQTHFPSYPPQQTEPLPQHSLRHSRRRRRRPAPTPTSSDPNPETLPLENLAEALSTQEYASGYAPENLAEQTHFADSLQQRANLPHHYPQRSWGPAAISTSPDPNPEMLPLENLAQPICEQESAPWPPQKNLAEQTHFVTSPTPLAPPPQKPTQRAPVAGDGTKAPRRMNPAPREPIGPSGAPPSHLFGRA
jgi:hypothetical protein